MYITLSLFWALYFAQLGDSSERDMEIYLSCEVRLHVVNRMECLTLLKGKYCMWFIEDSDRVSESNDNQQWAHAGSEVHLSCNASLLRQKVTWTKNGRPLPRYVTQKQDGSLFIRLAQKTDSGRYVCVIADYYGRQIANYIDLHIEGQWVGWYIFPLCFEAIVLNLSMLSRCWCSWPLLSFFFVPR